MSDEICRRCNRKQQRRRGGRSVQLPDWFYDAALFFETFMHVYTRTTYTTNIVGKKKETPH